MNNQSNLPRRLFSTAAAAVLLLVLYCCTPAPAAEPADWTANPTAGVVYEPLPEESGAGHE